MASNKRPKTSLNSIAASATSTCYQTPSSLSAEMVANNDDLLTEILVRLPINSVLAFKSLSKHWLSLISNPHFCRRSTALSNPSCGLFLLRPSISTNPNPVFDYLSLNQSSNLSNKHLMISLSFLTDPMGIKILQSCNGLLLCSTSGGPEARKKYYVYNPTTKHYTILPQLPVSGYAYRSTVMGLSLAFDPSKSLHYKVVCVKSRNSEQTQLEFEIYSSEMGAWPLSTSKSFLSPISTYNIDFNGGVFWNGAIHWISTREAAGALYFNLEEERLSEMPLPPLPEDWKDWNESQFGYFGESGDHLHVIGMYNPPSKCFNVYEMKRDYSGWFAKFRVDVAQVLVAFSNAKRFKLQVRDLSLFSFSIICVVRCEPEEDSCMVMHFHGGIIIKYYLKTDAFMKLCDTDDDGGDGLAYRDWTNNAHQFIKCLACV